MYFKDKVHINLHDLKTMLFTATIFMGNPDHGANAINFMAILLITTSLKDFQMYLMKFLQNSSQAFLNVKSCL